MQIFYAGKYSQFIVSYISYWEMHSKYHFMCDFIEFHVSRINYELLVTFTPFCKCAGATISSTNLRQTLALWGLNQILLIQV